MISTKCCFFSNRVIQIIFLAITLLTSACDESKRIDPAFVTGTVQNTCMELANSASKEKYGMPAKQSIHLFGGITMTWVGPSEFKFSQKSLFSLHNMYQANIPLDKSGDIASTYIEGILAGAALNTEDLAKIFPAVFDFDPQQRAVFYIRLECAPIHSKYHYNPIEPKATGMPDYALGLIDYPYGHSVISTPIDRNISNPDGSPIIIGCDSSRCNVAFFIEPNIWVRYDYPLSQRKNWSKIQKFIIDTINQAKE